MKDNKAFDYFEHINNIVKEQQTLINYIRTLKLDPINTNTHGKETNNIG